MATYKELFPNGDPRLTEIDPINPRALSAPQSFGSKLGAATRSALPRDGSAGFDQNQFQADLDALMGPRSTAAPSGDTQWGDSLKNLGAGLVETGAMATGALEYGSRQMLGGEDQSFVTDRLAAARRGLSGVAEDITASMSPEAQERLARQWLTLDPQQTIWQGGPSEFISAVGYKLGRSLPSTLVTLLPAARLFKAGMTPGAITYLGASEGGLSMGGIANGIATEIEGMTEEELQTESPRYQQMLREGLPAGVARQRLIEEAQGAAPLIGGATVGAISAVAGRYLEPVFASGQGMTLGRRALTGFGAEAPQEAGQSAAEQMAQNIAAQVYDSDRSPYEGVGEAAVEGGAIGGLMGGGFSAALGQRPQRPQQPAPPAAPTDQFVDPAVAAAIRNQMAPDDVAGPLAQQDWVGADPEQPGPPKPPMVGPPAPGPTMADRFGYDPTRDAALTQETKIPYAAPAGEPLAFGGTDPAGFAAIQDQFQYTYGEPPAPPSTALVPAQPVQQPLGLREPRQRGVGAGIITPTPSNVVDPMADQSAPPEFSNERLPVDVMPANRRPTRADFLRAAAEKERRDAYAGTVRDENQIDMFAAPPGAPGDPPIGGGAATPAGRQLLGFTVAGRAPDGNLRFAQDVATREEAQALVDEYSRNEQGELIADDDTLWTVEPVSVLTGQEKAPDQPTAEPMVDLEAQQEDLLDPDSPRMGLYLSRDNVAELRKQGTLDRVRSKGVPLMNFDLRGGTLIAKNRQVADELLAMRKQGLPMQEILGLATRAGTGKPADGQYVVQQRNDKGGVTREELVRTEQDAEAVAAQWEQEDPTRDVVVMRVDAALGRRATKVAKETKQREQQSERRSAQRAVGDAVSELPEDVQQGVLDHALNAQSRAAAADLIAEAGQVADSTMKRKGSYGFESPDSITFRPRRAATPERVASINERYRRMFDRYELLVDEEIALGMSIADNPKPAKFKAKKQPPGKRDRASEEVEAAQTAKRKNVADTRRKMRKIARERDALEEGLRTFKEAYEYDTTASKIVKAAEKVDAGAVRKRRASANITEPDRSVRTVSGRVLVQGREGVFSDRETLIPAKFGDMKLLTDEQIDALLPDDPTPESEARLEAEFMRAANFMSGLRPKRARDAEKTSDREQPVDAASKEKVVDAEAAGLTTQMMAGQTIDEYVDAYQTPSEKVKFIRRAQLNLRKKATGRSLRTMKRTVGRSRVNILSLIVPQESKAEIEASAKQREANRAEASAAFKELGQTVRSIESALVRIQGIEQDDVEGVAAGRAYLRNMYQLAISLLRSGDRSVAAAKAARKFSKAINDIIGKKDPKNLARRLTELGRREIRKGDIPAGKPKTFSDAFRAFVRGDLKDLTKFFRSMTKAQLNEVMSRPGKTFLKAAQRERLAQFERAAEKWFGGARQYYMDYIQPVLVNQRQNPTQEPTPLDIKRVRTALLWIGKSPQFSAMITDPIVTQLKDVGFTFNEKGVLTGWERSKEPREHFGAPPYGWTRNTEVSKISKRPLTPQEVEQKIDEHYAKEEQKRLAALQPMIDAYDRAVGRLMKAVNEAVAPTQLSLAEERFYATLKKLGVWKDDGIASLLPANARSYNKRVGPRLARKEITFSQAQKELRDTFIELGNVSQSPAKLVDDKLVDPKQGYRSDATSRALFGTPTKGESAAIDATTQMFYSRKVKVYDILNALNRSLEADHPLTPIVKALRNVPGIQQIVVTPSIFMLPYTGITSPSTVNDGTTYEKRRLKSRLDAATARRLEAQRKPDDPPLMFYSMVGPDGKENYDVYEIVPKRGNAFVEPAGITVGVQENVTSKERPAVIRAYVHEIVHAATITAIATNPDLRAAWEQLREITYKRARKSGKYRSLSYGDMNAYEFVAEVFSNVKLQQFMKQQKASTRGLFGTLWGRAVQLVRRAIGVDPEAENLLDLAMSLRDATFTGQEYTEKVHALSMTHHGKKSRTKGYAYTGIEAADDLIDRFRTTSAWRGRTYDFVKSNKEATHSGVLSAMTVSQISDFYSRLFETDDGSVLTKWYKAFAQRNADNSKNMEEVDRRSRAWSTLKEADRDNEANTSRVMTQATIHGVHPDLPLSDERNAHVKSPEKRAKHAELSKMYASLPEEWKKHYQAVKTYYAETHEKQQALAVLNALRAYLTTGRNAPMKLAAFEAKYNEDNVLKLGLNTQKKLKEEFADLIEKGELTTSAVSNIARLGALRKMSDGPYFPVMRFGEYAVYAEKLKETKRFGTTKELNAYREAMQEADPTLQFSRGEDNLTLEVREVEFRMAETPSEAQKHYEEMVGLYGKFDPKTGEGAKPVNIRRDAFSEKAAISGTRGLRTVLDKLEGNAAAQAAIKNFYLASLADTSFRKHEARRKNTRGFPETEQHRTFAAYSKAAAYYMSQLRFGWKLADARTDMEAIAKDRGIRAGQVLREIKLRDDMTVDPEEVSPGVVKANEITQFMLLSSISYWAINLTQPWMVTMPYLGAKYGQVEAAKALGRAQALIFDPIKDEAKASWLGMKALTSKAAAERAFTVLDEVKASIKRNAGDKADAYLDMLTTLQRQSIIDLSFVAELRQIADGQNVNTRWQRVLDASRIMSHITEVNNRIMTAVAAYDLTIAKGQGHEEAVAAAESAVERTQFNYSGANAPRLFQQGGPLGKAGPLLFQFMKYPQHMYALMTRQVIRLFSNKTERREALRVLAGLSATHLAVGGVLGWTLQPMKWMLGMIIAGLNDEDDRAADVISGATYDRFVRQAAYDALGDDLGRALSKGPIGALLGIDLSSRMSLGTLYFIDLKPENTESLLGSLVSTFGGPALNVGMTALNAPKYLMEGDVSKAVEAVTPKFVKDAFKAARFADEGITGRDGTVYLGADEITAGNTIAQGLGFGTMRASESYARGDAVRVQADMLKDRRGRLIRRFVNADSEAERADALEAIREFSKTSTTPITRSDILKAMRRRLDRNMRIEKFGADLRGRNVLLADAGDPYAYGEE